MKMIPLVRATEPGRAQSVNQSLWLWIVVFVIIASVVFDVSLIGKWRHRGWESRLSLKLLRVRYESLESRSLELERKMWGNFPIKLNIDSRPIANKYCEGKVKRTLERGLKVPEIGKREANETSFWAWDCFKGGLNGRLGTARVLASWILFFECCSCSSVNVCWAFGENVLVISFLLRWKHVPVTDPYLDIGKR